MPPGRSLDPAGNGRARGMIAASISDLRSQIFKSEMFDLKRETSDCQVSKLEIWISNLKSERQNSAYRLALNLPGLVPRKIVFRNLPLLLAVSAPPLRHQCAPLISSITFHKETPKSNGQSQRSVHRRLCAQ